MTARTLLVNPPIFDFSAYDFWLKPYGMLRVYLDRLHPNVSPGNTSTKNAAAPAT